MKLQQEGYPLLYFIWKKIKFWQNAHERVFFYEIMTTIIINSKSFTAP